MKKFKIEKNIPIPPEHPGKGMSAALRSLKKGESVLLPTSRKNIGGILLHIGGIGCFVCRTVGVKKTRVWRIKK